MRNITLSKDNYGAARFLDGFTVQREITPRVSARSVEIEYEETRMVDMPAM